MGKKNREHADPAVRTGAPRGGTFVRFVAGLLCLCLPALVQARPSLPPPPALPPPPPGIDAGADGVRGNPRNLSAEQRDAIRRLSEEQREAIANRQAQRQQGRPGAPGPRLSPEERRQLRQQIREEHERRGGRFGRRP